MDIIIRNVALETDIQGIRETHGSDDHFDSDEEWFWSSKTSLENGFLIQVALCENKIVGHAEWVISDEPRHRFLYLGMMQVHEAYQKRGIGLGLAIVRHFTELHHGTVNVESSPNGSTFSVTIPIAPPEET